MGAKMLTDRMTAVGGGRRTMKTLLVLLCALLTLTACGAGGDSGAAADVPSVSAEPAPETPEPEKDDTETRPDGPSAPAGVSEGEPLAAEPEPAPRQEPTPAAADVPAQTADPVPVQTPEPVPEQTDPVLSEENTGGQEEISVAKKMNVQVGTYTFTATLEVNDAVRELAEMLRTGPVTLHMSDYAGFEKVGPLGKGLPASNSQTTTAAGDIVLYNGNNIVMFYGSNSWSYTRIGKIDDLTDWAAALGGGDITAVFTLAE